MKKGKTILLFLMLVCSMLVLTNSAAAQEDTAGPRISAPFPVDLVNDPTPLVGAAVIDESGILIEEASLSIDGAPPVMGFVYDSSTGIISTEWPIPLPDGIHSAVLHVTDLAGNISTSTWNFTVDTTPPVITRGTPEEGTVQVIGSNMLPEYDVFVTDENRVSEARFFLNDIPQSNCTLMDWGTSQLAFIPSNPFYPDGLVDVRIELKDNAGNLTMRRWQVSVEGRPLISSYAPSGVTTTYTPTIKAYIRDYFAVDTGTMLMSIDGGPEMNVASYYNPNTKYLTYPVTTPFTPEKHTITLKARCTNGHETVATWSFWYDFESPTVNKVSLLNYPTQGKIFEVKEGTVLPRGKDLSFQFNTSEQLYLFQLTLDGVPVQANGSYIYWSRLYNTGWSLNTMTLGDGPHNLTINMVDAGMNNGTYSINFTVAEAPVISGEKPVNLANIPVPIYNHLNYYSELTDRRFEAILTDSQPQISMKVTDGNDTLTQGDITFKLDGVEKPFSFDQSTGLLTYNTPEKLEDEMVHTINVTAQDRVNTTRAEWKFYINTYPIMKWATDKTCVTCHAESGKLHFPAAPEETAQYGTNCKDCHGTYVARTMDQRCIACHRDYWHITVYPQVTFHEVSHSDQTGIPTVTLDMAHRAETGSCSPCHAKSINREHARSDRTDANGNPITCDTCHLSSSAIVRQAIDSGDASCGACHGASGEGHEVVHTSNLDGNCTSTCHKASLTQEHLNNPKTQAKALSCDTCHNSANPLVAAAIVNNRIECAACHFTGHNVFLTPKVDEDIPAYPGLKWTTPMSGRLWAGEIPSEYLDGYIVLSSAAAVTGEDVLAYYREHMASNGWIEVSANSNTLTRFDLIFEKAGRPALVRYLQVSGKEGPLGRIILIYK